MLLSLYFVYKPVFKILTCCCGDFKPDRLDDLLHISLLATDSAESCRFICQSHQAKKALCPPVVTESAKDIISQSLGL